jgi:hypothetical protein
MIKKKGICFAIFIYSIILSSSVTALTNTEKVKNKHCLTPECKQQFKDLKRYARYEIPAAQNMMGVFYYNGHGVEQDHVKARRYFYKAAKWGNASSQFRLGLMMINGEGGDANFNLGMINLKKAANSVPMANYYLGVYYLKNEQSTENLILAEKHLSDAATRGYDRANFLLAKIYESGALGKIEQEKAIDLYKKIADKEDRAKQRLITLGIDLPRKPKNTNIEKIIVSSDKSISFEEFLVGLAGKPSLKPSIGSSINRRTCPSSGCSSDKSSISGEINLNNFRTSLGIR